MKYHLQILNKDDEVIHDTSLDDDFEGFTDLKALTAFVETSGWDDTVTVVPVPIPETTTEESMLKGDMFPLENTREAFNNSFN